MTKLEGLDLSNNGMSSFPQNAFSTFTSLSTLFVDGNDLNAAVAAKTFDGLPQSLTGLYMGNGGLTSVPSQIFQQNGRLVFVALFNNKITSVKKNDFGQSSSVTQVLLSDNPIASIEQGALQALAKVPSLALTNTRLAAFDLSLLNGMTELTELKLDNSGALTSLTATNSDQVPQNISLIQITKSALQSISADVEKVVSRANFKKLDISENTNIICDQNVIWLAKYALCPQTGGNITMQNTKCKTGVLLSQYLNETAPDPCGATQSTQPTTAPPSSANTWYTLTTLFITPIGIFITAFNYRYM